MSALGSDANLVGFYVSTYHGQHLATPGFLDALIAIQLGAPTASASSRVQASSVTRSARAPPLAQASTRSSQGGKGVAIVYDLASASQGTVDLKAFKLSQAFVDAHRAGRFDSQRCAVPSDHSISGC